MNGRRFPEFRYFTRITTISNQFGTAKWAYIDFRNITSISSASGTNPTNMHICSFPNVSYADSFPKGRNSWTGDSATNTAFYMPKVQGFYNIWCNWYNRGVIRWFIVGTQSESIPTLTGGVSAENVLSKANFKGFFVPDDMVDDYKADSKWSNVASKIFPISDFESMTGETVPTE